MHVLERHSWPGNVRELANIVERISIVSPGAEITAEYVRAVLSPADVVAPIAIEPAVAEMSGGLSEVLDSNERRLIQNALDQSKGNIAEAARILKTDRPNLYRRMKRLGLE
jgi:DNA-binding NtrC family response regulator